MRPVVRHLSGWLSSFSSNSQNLWLSHRCAAATRTFSGVGDSMVDVFDRDIKAAERERASQDAIREDPLLSLVTDRLLDRLEDCVRKFPRAVVLGGAGWHVVKRLLNERAGINELWYLDLSHSMLEKVQQEEVAARTAGSQAWPRMHYVQADEEFLPFQPASVDLVVSCLGMQWVNDVPEAMAQCCKALKPDGLFLSAMFGGDTLQELRIACAVAQQEREGGVSPVVSPLAQVRDAGNLLTRANLALPTVDTDTITMHYPSALQLVEHLRMMGETNALKGRERRLRRDVALAGAATYQAMFAEEDGTVAATYQVMYLTGWAPAASQPKAVARGSATISFKELASELGKRGAVTGSSGVPHELQEGTAAETSAEPK